LLSICDVSHSNETDSGYGKPADKLIFYNHL